MGMPSPALTAAGKASDADAGTRLRGVLLAVTWVVWVALALLCLVNFVGSIPNYLLAVHAYCQPGVCVAGQPTAATAQTLRQFGLSPGGYAALSVGLVCITALVYCGAAAMIIWRRPGD